MKPSIIFVILVALLILLGCTDETKVTVVNHTSHNAQVKVDTMEFYVGPHLIAQEFVPPDTAGREGRIVELLATIGADTLAENPYLDPGDNFVWNLYAGEAIVTVFNHTNVVAAVMIDTSAFSLNPNQGKTTEVEWFGSLIDAEQLSLIATLDGSEVYYYPFLMHGDEITWDIYSGTSYIDVVNNSGSIAMVTIADESDWGLNPGYNRLYAFEWYGSQLDSMEVKLYAINGDYEYYAYPVLADEEQVTWTLEADGTHTIQ